MLILLQVRVYIEREINNSDRGGNHADPLC